MFSLGSGGWPFHTKARFHSLVGSVMGPRIRALTLFAGSKEEAGGKMFLFSVSFSVARACNTYLFVHPDTAARLTSRHVAGADSQEQWFQGLGSRVQEGGILEGKNMCFVFLLKQGHGEGKNLEQSLHFPVAALILIKHTEWNQFKYTEPDCRVLLKASYTQS